MIRYDKFRFILALAFLGIQCNSDKGLGKSACPDINETQYLAFQLFVSGTTEPSDDYQGLGPFISQAQMEDFFSTVRSKIGPSNAPCRRPAIMIGPIALDFSSADIANLIEQSFELAKRYDMAVGFHIDDGMFWANRKDLWQNPENIEWTDWNGSPNTSRFVDWVRNKLAPEMCFNAPAVKAAVKEFISNISISIKSNYDQLVTSNREYLYAGTIIGWETSLDTDRDTQLPSGYHALKNKGFGQGNLPVDIDEERVKILQEYIQWMAEPLIEAGLPVGKTYAHIAFLSRKIYDHAVSINPDFAKKSYNELNNFSPPEVAVGLNYTPGFSTYPQDGLFDQIHTLVQNSHWASSEGTNLVLGMPPVSSGYNMESYLARQFNHGCRLVNLFAFHVRGDAFTDALNDASEGPVAIEAYKKFLNGTPLKE